MYSIQNRILLGLAVIFTVSTLVLLGWTWSTTSHEVEELYDASLVQVTRQFSDQLTLAPDLSNLAALRAAMKRTEANRPQISSHDDEYEEAYEGQRYGLNDDDPGHHYEHHLSIQVWHADGRLLLSSPATLQLPAPQRSGLDTQFSSGNALRTYTLYRPDDQLWIRGGQPLSLRAEMSNEVAEHVLLPLAVVIACLIAAITLAINVALRPLKQISQELDRRNSEDLSPIDDDKLPAEVRAPVTSLNRMFQRVADTLQRERRFTSDAAHELRTPLAALRVHIERLRLPTDDATPLARGLDRLERVVTQLLMLARLEPRRHRELQKTPLDMVQICSQLIAELVPLALQRNIQIELKPNVSEPFHGEHTLVEILLRNLLENAIRYTNPDDVIVVSLSQQDSVLEISVTDHGPGLDDDQKAQVVQRFYRQHKADTQGAGLGFSIIDQITALHGGTFQLEDTPDTGGLSVRVTLPR